MKATVIGSQADKAMTRLVLLARAVMVIVLLLCVLDLRQASAQPAAQPARPAQPAAPPAPPPTTDARIINWLDCVECSNQELDVLARQGDAIVPALRQVLLNGPSQDRLDAKRRSLESAYQSMKQYEQRRPDRAVPLTEQQYIARYQEKFVLLNRTRAARALGVINSPEARRVLVQALQANPQPELRRDLERALKPQR